MLEEIRPYTPPIIMQRLERIRNKRLKFPPSPIPMFPDKADKMILIGNGPSLNKSVELYKDEVIRSDRLAVNFFALSELYEVLRPNYYLFVDPAFFDIPDNQHDTIQRLIDVLVRKTSWRMRLCAPLGVENTPLVNALKKNPNIEFVYYFGGERNIGELSIYEAWDRNLVCPPNRNSLNVGLYLALYWGYAETFFIGLDMSSLEDIRIDQTTNELFSIDTHFYNNKQVYSDKKLFDNNRGRIRSDWKLHEYIYTFGKMFENFYDLSLYAQYKGLKVYNASEYSWVNCFDRKKLK